MWGWRWDLRFFQQRICRGLLLAIALIMESSTSETSVNFYQTTRRNMLEDSHINRSDDGDSKHLWKGCKFLLVYRAQHPRRQSSICWTEVCASALYQMSLALSEVYKIDSVWKTVYSGKCVNLRMMTQFMTSKGEEICICGHVILIE
jgi:hypothetical protein